MCRLVVSVLLCALVCACSGARLNRNASDLATSLNSLTKRQIFYNLAQAFNDPQFVPSQVTIAAGNAQTSNLIQPSLTVPFSPTVAATNTYGPIATSGTMANTTTLAGPGLTLAANEGWQQSWTLTPLMDSDQIGRLRSLYNYVVSTSAQSRALDDAAKYRDLLCFYPLQAFAISLNVAAGNLTTPKPAPAASAHATAASGGIRTFNVDLYGANLQVRGAPEGADTIKSQKAIDAAVDRGKAIIVAFDNGNAIIKMRCPTGSDGTLENIFRYADPTFLLGPSCVLCLDDRTIGPVAAGAKSNQIEVRVNPKLKPSFIFNRPGERRSEIGSYSSLDSGATFYVEDDSPGSGARAFSDFILLTYDAMAQTGGAASGKTNGTGTFVLALPP